LTPLQKWKLPRSKPPRSKADAAQSLVGQPFLAVLLFFHDSFRFLSDNLFGSLSLSATQTLCVFFCFFSTFNSRLSTSFRSPPVYNELPSWLLNLACLTARAPANSS